MFDNIRFWSLFLLIAGTIVFVGWKQPLRYRFLSPEEIYAIENPPPPPAPMPERTKESWIFDRSRKTPLDRDPYNTNGYVGGTRQPTQGAVPYSR